MRLIISICAACAAMVGAVESSPKAAVYPADEDHAAVYENAAERDARMQWWRQAKFGMFIHYGLYSGLAGEFQGRPGGGEWIQQNLGLDTDTYAAEARPLFVPAKGCTDAWAALAEQAGCRYIILTSKHHEGFALFDTETTDFHAPHDVVGEFVASARKHGLRVGFYHSVIDWHHPAYDDTIAPALCYPKGQHAMLAARGIPRDHAAYQAYLHEQVRELLTKYGKIDIIWWDYSQDAASGQRGWQAPRLIEMTRELQPGIIMNNRLYAYSGYDTEVDSSRLDLRCGDFITPEKRLPGLVDAATDWESCMTLGYHWGYNKNDTNYKSPAQIIRCLQQCAAYGGNLLLNISPRGDGSIPEGAVEVFQRVGRWMAINGEAIYCSTPAKDTEMPQDWMVSQVGEDYYLFPPALQPTEPVTVRIATQRPALSHPHVLGQPDCRVSHSLLSERESHAVIQLTIPASAWQNAPEGLPVIKLTRRP